MIAVDDFTRFPQGDDTIEGPIERCPLCGRNGIRQHLEDGVAYFLHKESSEMQSDGLLTQPLEFCSLPRED